jgi:hypothetical protein
VRYHLQLTCGGVSEPRWGYDIHRESDKEAVSEAVRLLRISNVARIAWRATLWNSENTAPLAVWNIDHEPTLTPEPV